jgi:hypothetical protein
MAWSEVAARHHARRLESEGWLERYPMTRGEGSLFVATRAGVAMVGIAVRGGGEAGADVVGAPVRLRLDRGVVDRVRPTAAGVPGGARRSGVGGDGALARSPGCTPGWPPARPRLRTGRRPRRHRGRARPEVHRTPAPDPRSPHPVAGVRDKPPTALRVGRSGRLRSGHSHRGRGRIADCEGGRLRVELLETIRAQTLVACEANRMDRVAG